MKSWPRLRFARTSSTALRPVRLSASLPSSMTFVKRPRRRWGWLSCRARTMASRQFCECMWFISSCSCSTRAVLAAVAAAVVSEVVSFQNVMTLSAAPEMSWRVVGSAARAQTRSVWLSSVAAHSPDGASQILTRPSLPAEATWVIGRLLAAVSEEATGAGSQRTFRTELV